LDILDLRTLDFVQVNLDNSQNNVGSTETGYFGTEIRTISACMGEYSK